MYTQMTTSRLCLCDQVLFQFVGFSRVADGLGVLRCFRAASLLCAPIIFLVPFLSHAPQAAQVPMLILCILSSRLLVSSAFSALAVIINNSVNSR
jgi:hypothetical protein